MKHVCDIEHVSSVERCAGCGLRWLKQNDGSYRAENRGDRRASRRAFAALARQNARQWHAAVAATAKARAAKRSFGAKRLRQSKREEAAA